GDAMNPPTDMRARLFRERSPAAFGILTDPNPPALAKVPETMTVAEAVEISSRALTVGEEQFKKADALLRQGKTNEAIVAFEKLRGEFRQTWIDRVSQERLARLGYERDRPLTPSLSPAHRGEGARKVEEGGPRGGATDALQKNERRAAKYPRAD